jgi:hypothetical protein
MNEITIKYINKTKNTEILKNIKTKEEIFDAKNFSAYKKVYDNTCLTIEEFGSFFDNVDETLFDKDVVNEAWHAIMSNIFINNETKNENSYSYEMSFYFSEKGYFISLKNLSTNNFFSLFYDFKDFKIKNKITKTLFDKRPKAQYEKDKNRFIEANYGIEEHVNRNVSYIKNKGGF